MVKIIPMKKKLKVIDKEYFKQTGLLFEIKPIRKRMRRGK